jgi:hypothetical protein
LASKNRSKGRSGGRVTPPSGRRASTTSTRDRSKSAAPTKPTKSTKSTRERRADIDVKAVDRLVERANRAIPKGRVRSAFSATGPISPNMVTVLGSVPAVVLVAVSLSLKAPLLLLVALAVMVLSMLGLMRGVNSTVVVAELPDEIVGLTNTRGELVPRFRVPGPLQVSQPFDPRWLKVEVAGDHLWVSKKAFGEVVAALAPPAETEADPGDEAGASPGDEAEASPADEAEG